MTHDLTGPVASPELRALLSDDEGQIDRVRLARLADVLGWAIAETPEALHVIASDPTWRPELLTEIAADILAFPGIPASVLRARLPAMAGRAESRLRGRGATPPTDAPDVARVRVPSRELGYAAYFAVEDYLISHPRFDGSQTTPLPRAVFVLGDACVVLPYDAARDRVLLVEQFRCGPFARGDAAPWLVETVAGRIDAGETPEDCARREAVEEAGVTLGDLVALPEYYPSPGAQTEYIYSYIGQADLPDNLPRQGGLADEDEDIRLHLVDLAEAMRLMDSGAIRNAPVQIALMALWRDREAIRRRFGVETAGRDA